MISELKTLHDDIQIGTKIDRLWPLNAPTEEPYAPHPGKGAQTLDDRAHVASRQFRIRRKREMRWRHASTMEEKPWRDKMRFGLRRPRKTRLSRATR